MRESTVQVKCKINGTIGRWKHTKVSPGELIFKPHRLVGHESGKCINQRYRWYKSTVPLIFWVIQLNFFINRTVDFLKDYRWSRISTVDLHILPSIANDGTDDINQLYRWFQNQLYRWSVPLIFVVVPLFWYFVTAGFSPFLYRWSKSTVQSIKSLVPLIWNQR